MSEGGVFANEKDVAFVNVMHLFFMSGIVRPGFISKDFTHGSHSLSWFQMTSDGEGFMLVRVDL